MVVGLAYEEESPATPEEIADAVMLTARWRDLPNALALLRVFDVRAFEMPSSAMLARRGEYARVDAVPLIYIDGSLCGDERELALLHEFGHHVIWWWNVAVADEEAFAEAVASELFDRLRGSATRLKHAEPVLRDERVEETDPLDDALVDPAFRAA